MERAVLRTPYADSSSGFPHAGFGRSPPSFNAFRYARQFEFLESRWFLCKVKANLRRYSSQRASGKKEPKQTIGETF
jgi:hypothetical protein